MIVVNSYRLENKAVFLFVVALESRYCPVCQTMLMQRGTRKRVLCKSDSEKQMLIIRRLRCESCKRIHHELPDCIVPYKRYGASPIEAIVNGADEVCGNNTARRIRAWWETVKPYFLAILLTLVERFSVSFGKPPAFKEIVRAVANSNNWVFAHQLCTRSGATGG